MKPLRVRAVYRAAQVADRPAPYDNVTLKLHYPCRYGDSFEERDTVFIPPDTERAPFPVVIIMPGVNISLEAYGWLAHELAQAGFAVVTYSWVTVEMADRVSISPGVALDALYRDRYGTAPSCPALPAILAELERVQQEGLLAGQLDLGQIMLGGHSAGGTMALLNAHREWLPSVRGAFAYAAHTAGNVRLGWPDDSIMPLARDLPFLILGGTRDGVIAASSHRYRGEAGGVDPNGPDRAHVPGGDRRRRRGPASPHREGCQPFLVRLAPRYEHRTPLSGPQGPRRRQAPACIPGGADRPLLPPHLHGGRGIGGRPSGPCAIPSIRWRRLPRRSEKHTQPQPR